MATRKKVAPELSAQKADKLVQAIVQFQDGEVSADSNIFDNAADFLRRTAVKVSNLKLGWIVSWLVPDWKKVLAEVVDLLNVLADAVDKYGEDEA